MKKLGFRESESIEWLSWARRFKRGQGQCLSPSPARVSAGELTIRLDIDQQRAAELKRMSLAQRPPPTVGWSCTEAAEVPAGAHFIENAATH